MNPLVMFLKKLAIAICFLLVLFIAGLLFDKPGLFPAVVAIIGAIFVLYLVYGKRRLPEAMVVAAIFGAIAIFGLGSFDKVKGFFSPATIVAAEAPTQKAVVAEEPRCVYEGRYPNTVAQWCFLIEAEAAEHGIDPLLVASVIKHESNGQPHAGSTVQVINGIEYHTSVSGAVGLMQVMPSDGISAYAQCINGPCFAGRPTSAELYDPAYNIHFGTQMLAGLINKWGSVREGLLHYGPDPDSLFAVYGDYYWYADLILLTYNGL